MASSPTPTLAERAKPSGARLSAWLTASVASLFVHSVALAAASPQESDGGPPPFEPPPLCPEPLIVEPRWEPLELTAEGRIVVAGVGLEQVAGVLSDDLAALTGLRLAVTGVPARSGDIVLSLGYLPDFLQSNPEAFTIETYDHVAIAGQTPAGVACAIARFLQLVPVADPTVLDAKGEVEPSADGARVVLAPIYIADAPSMRWRLQEIDPIECLDAAPDPSPAVARRLVARAHLTGFNALTFGPPPGLVVDAEAHAALTAAIEDEAARRGLVVTAPFGGKSAILTAAVFTAEGEHSVLESLGSVARSLEAQDSVLLCAGCPFPPRFDIARLGTDEVTALSRAARFLYPIVRPATVATDSAQASGDAEAPRLRGSLFGPRIRLQDDTQLPMLWCVQSLQLNSESAAALATEGWHGGLKRDSLRGTPALERVLARVTGISIGVTAIESTPRDGTTSSDDRK